MYGLDGQLIHAPSGRPCAQTEAANDAARHGTIGGEKSTINSLGQALGTCIKGNCSDGFGLYTWPDGTKYKGNFKQGRQHGHGAILLPSGAKDVWASGSRACVGARARRSTQTAKKSLVIGCGTSS